MGTRGPTSNAPGGYGTITPKGYRRVWDIEQQRFRMEHVLVWEKNNASIPEGMQIHHKDEDKLNNTIENLELVDTLTHKRIHSGCEFRDGEWWKPCCKCERFQQVSTSFYERKSGISPWCKKCCITNAVDNKRKRREGK